MTKALCEASTCRPEDHGGPRRTEPGRPLCRWCADGFIGNVEAISSLWPDLEDRLAVSGAPDTEPVSGSSSPGLMINEDVSDAMTEIADWALWLTRTVVSEANVSAPSEHVPILLAWLARWHAVRLTRHADDGLAVAVVDDAARYRSLAYKRAFPAPVRRVEIPGQCVLHDASGHCCGGTIFALVRPDARLPSEIRCERDDAHRIPSADWSTYGQRMLAMLSPAGLT